jgi:hypothetical protein
MNLDELMNDLGRQRWIGELHEPPIDVDVPKTKQQLIDELNRLGQEGLIRYGPNGWEALSVRTAPQRDPQKALF